MRSKSMKLVSVALVVAVVLLGGNIMLLATGAPAQAAVQIDRDRIKNVIYPTFGYPSITRCGDNMAIEFDPRDQDWSKPLPELDEFRVTATTTNSQYPLVETLKVNYYYIAYSQKWPEYSRQANPKALIYILNVTVPEDVPVHLFDLTVVARNNGATVLTDSQPHALQTVIDFKTDYQFAQLTDIHVWGPEAAYPGACTIERNYRHANYSETDGYGAAYYHKTIQQLNVEKPDFILYTGDYDFSQKWLYQENYGSFSQYASTPWNGKYFEPWFEMDWFYQETLKLDVPVFMVLGNHDGYARYDFFNINCQEDYANSWRDLFGPQYFSFDYGSDYHFSAVDSMDWTSIDRNLHWAIPNVILSPENWQGQVQGGGDPFLAGWSQAREDAINENTFTGQLMWLRDDLAAHSAAKIRTVVMHHDPWKQAGTGVMFDNPGGQGDGRLAVIKLLRENNVALVLSGHDHSDEYGSIAWEHGGGTVNFVNTTSVMLQDAASVFSQDFTSMPVYPGYRLVHVNDTSVVNYNYVTPYWSWPVYQNTNVGGNTNFNNLSTPSVVTTRTTVAPDDLQCQVANHLVGSEVSPGNYAGDLNGAGAEFPMPYLSGGYYYQVTGGTFGDIFDNSETSPDHRIYEVNANVPHSSTATLEVKKSGSPDTTPPTCSDFHIDMTDPHVREVTVHNDATDLESGVLDMKLWNDGESESSAEWQRWQTDTSWTLRNGAGTRTVYVKFRDAAMPGNESVIYSATATLIGAAPVVTGVPVSARVGDSVVITGTDFGSQSASDMVQFNGVLAKVTDWQDTQITCEVPIGASTGTVTVTNDGGEASHSFTVLPTLQYVVPDSGYNNAPVHIEDLHGTGFASGSGYPQVKLTDGTHEIAATNVQYVSPESVSCDFDITGATVGDYGIQIVNPDHNADFLDSSFAIDYPPPELNSMTPSTGLNNGSVNITDIAGDWFRSGMSVFLMKGSDVITASDVQVVSAHKATCALDLTGAAAGQWDVWVQNDDGETTTIAQGFTIGYPAPAVSSITPSSGYINGAVQVSNLAGGNFRAGATVKLSNGGTSDYSATDVSVVSPTRITCKFDLTGLAAGAWDVVVQNNDGKTGVLAGGFQTKWSTTHVDSVTPGVGKAGDQVTISGSNFGAGPGAVTFGGNPVEGVVSWAPSKIVCRVPVGASGDSPLVVTSATGPSNAAGFTTAQPAWYLAEGSTAWGFSTYITVANPNDATATIDVTYMTSAGAVTGGTMSIKPQSQLTINPSSFVPNKDFSTKITCREGLDIACDRTMSWRDGLEGHSSVGVAGPAKTWFMPEGSAAYGFETWLLVQNPNGTPAKVNITYMIEGQGPETVAKTVPASSRASFNMESDVGQKSAAIRVDSDVPVIPERSVYRNGRREGSDSIGTTVPATDYYLAEGSTSWGFTTYVLVQNPNDAAAAVTLTYMTPEGAVAKGPFNVPGRGRTTFRANDQVPNTDISVKVHADRPIVAERAMYWDNGTGEACHDSIGLAPAHTRFCLPDGQTSQGRQTFTLVQNPNASEVTIEVTYMTDTSGGNVTFDDKVPANSRRTYDMSKVMSPGRASVLVQCKTAGKKVMVERSMYWNNKGAGTDSIGSYAE